MVPPPFVPVMMPGPVIPAIQPNVAVLSGNQAFNKPSIIVVKSPEPTAQTIIDDVEIESRHKTHRVFGNTPPNNTKRHEESDKNRLEAHELPGYKRDEPEADSVVIYVAKSKLLHELPVVDATKISNSTENANTGAPTESAVKEVDTATKLAGEDESSADHPSIELLHNVAMDLMNRLVNNIREKEKEFLAGKVSQNHQHHVAAVTICKSAVRDGADFSSCMHSITNKQDDGQGFVDFTEHTVQARNNPGSEIEFSLPLSPQFITAIDVFNRLPEVKVKHLEALSRMMEAEAELHNMSEEEYWQWRDFREFSASFRQGVLKVIEFTRRHRRHRKSGITCDQLQSAFQEIFTLAEAIEDGIIFESELSHYEPTKYLVKHPEIHELYQRTLTKCVKKKELKNLKEASELESNVDLRMIADANRGTHWTEADSSLSFPRKDDRHRDQRNHKRDEPDVSNNATEIVILPRAVDEAVLEHGIMHLNISLGSLAALGSILLLVSVFCTWFKQCWTRRMNRRQPPPMSLPYSYTQDTKSSWDQESA